MSNRDIAEDISARLQLASPPIALSFVDAAPGRIPLFDHAVPSACTFWRRAESRVFYAPAEQHFGCPIGALTMGFELPETVREHLMDTVHYMAAAGYLALEEAGKVPSVRRKKAGIVYGPLRDLPVEPDLVLLWLTPRQAMLFSEAAGTCRWTEEAPTAVFGRPSCAALPIAYEQSHTALSLGCAGMRIYTAISDNRLLAVIPGKQLQAVREALAATLDANATMQTHYEAHRAQFAT